LLANCDKHNGSRIQHWQALQLQFFMVQTVNYSMIIVKIKCKNPQYHK